VSASEGQPNRDLVVSFRVTPAERAVLKMVAAVEGETLTSFVRDTALGVAAGILAEDEREAGHGR
jgi:uncharacterized protein (DUF1778 family)